MENIDESITVTQALAIAMDSLAESINAFIATYKMLGSLHNQMQKFEEEDAAQDALFDKPQFESKEL